MSSIVFAKYKSYAKNVRWFHDLKVELWQLRDRQLHVDRAEQNTSMLRTCSVTFAFGNVCTLLNMN